MKRVFGCLEERIFAKFAEVFASFLEPGTVVLLVGELGSGKTSFVRYCSSRLGLDPAQVRSPTFTLVNVYKGRVNVYHIDLYRIDKDVEVLMELEEILELRDGVVFVEWADRIDTFWSGEEIKIAFDFCENGRIVSVESQDERFLSELSKRWSEVAQV
ncbi:MAG: tRNA (adenosine(37)-N6)-threonylcarbamoyltransferase complex ATPase subunit type 1 TsaE [Pseudothermotoga sp.]|uniref:tRNA (adenosine(37)-N6)-threonylcarbamoyltransferase complex ATPase subunit type 1 TsaE n=1 Tax=Pseudothermotoga sp. TaxID=2033661 RepID=UPI002588123D|nr:tRNA (adenosine(37)-N6)-threonylcarbamoyltransferase complex ATPase subunit type 1 TsaE [Pseudothermotoga sp.]MDI6862316.1 tRNA (adenosine(37)-N6)-threonylcarbamoyltransferase complex ATPase subunit type 1 TsaE [Pseudothermotoga sp.]